MCRVHDTSISQDLGELLSDGNNRWLGSKESGVLQDVDENWSGWELTDVHNDLSQVPGIIILRYQNAILSSNQWCERDPDMHGDVGECVSIVAKKVQRICGNLQKCLWVFEGFIWELIDFDWGNAHVVEACFNVMNGPGAWLRLVCQISQDKTFVHPHLTSQFIPWSNPWLSCDKLTNLVAQASESSAKAAFHCVLNT